MGKTGKRFRFVDKRRGTKMDTTPMGTQFVTGNLIGGCLTKQAFPHESVARRVATQMGAKHGRAFETYLCCFCGKYHVSGLKGRAQ